MGGAGPDLGAQGATPPPGVPLCLRGGPPHGKFGARWAGGRPQGSWPAGPPSGTGQRKGGSQRPRETLLSGSVPAALCVSVEGAPRGPVVIPGLLTMAIKPH